MKFNIGTILIGLIARAIYAHIRDLLAIESVPEKRGV